MSRERARQLAREHVEKGDPLGWFERLYAEAGSDHAAVPWADLRPNPHLAEWLRGSRHRPASGSACAVGCGYGDDVRLLADAGYAANGFDISRTAIEVCRRRFPDLAFRDLDLLALPADAGRYALVAEVYTLQVLPYALRRTAIAAIAGLVAPGGVLLVVCRAREPADPEGAMPWPLTRAELFAFEAHGLRLVEFEDFLDDEEPRVRRFRAAFARA